MTFQGFLGTGFKLTKSPMGTVGVPIVGFSKVNIYHAYPHGVIVNVKPVGLTFEKAVCVVTCLRVRIISL